MKAEGKAEGAPNLQALEGKLASAEKELASVEGKLASVEGKLASTEEKLASTEDKLASAEGKAGGVPNLQALEEKLASAEGKAGGVPNLQALEEKLASAEDKLASVEKELASMKEAWLRASAEVQNTEKRAWKRQESLMAHARLSSVGELLPLADSCQEGLAAAEKAQSLEEVSEGFRLVFRQVQKIFDHHALVKIEPQLGEDFNPHLHEAACQKASEHVGQGGVVETLRTGYQAEGQLLRAASVVVSSGAQQAKDSA